MQIIGNNSLEITLYNRKKENFYNLNCLQVFDVLNHYLGNMIYFNLNNKIFNQPKVEIKDDDLIPDKLQGNYILELDLKEELEIEKC